MGTGALFLEDSAEYLAEVYLPRIETAIEQLTDEDLWWRPHGTSHGVAHLLAHLQGNVRQWILSGLGGEPDDRKRAEEFSPPEQRTREDLWHALAATVVRAAEILREFPDARLEQPVKIQGFEMTGLQAIYHVVEHFSWHTGQIVWIAKLRLGQSHGIAFYDEAAINAARNDGPSGGDEV